MSNRTVGKPSQIGWVKIEALARSVLVAADSKDYISWSLLAALFYIAWALFAKTQASDFNTYVFAGYATREGVTPYYVTQDWQLLVDRYKLPIFPSPYLYPPSFGQLMAILVSLQPWTLRIVWLVVSILVTSLSVISLRQFFPNGAPRYMLLGTLLYLPILNALAAGNVNPMLLGIVAFLIFLSRQRRVAPQPAMELLSGLVLGASLFIKPFLVPFVIWSLFRQRYWMAAGCSGAIVIALFASIEIGGINPWLDYAHNMMTLGPKLQSYVENQSIAVFVGRVSGEDLGRIVELALPGIVLLAWLIWFRHLPEQFDLAALSVLNVLINPINWYYYFIFLLPAYWYFFSHGSWSKWTLRFTAITYVLIQLHGAIWSRAEGHLVFGNLALFGLVILAALVFYDGSRPGLNEPQARESLNGVPSTAQVLAVEQQPTRHQPADRNLLSHTGTRDK